MSREKTLVYLSNCAVDRNGTPDPFLMQELPWLLRHFDRVLMVSCYGAAELTGVKPESLKRISAKGSPLTACRAVLRAPFAREFWQELGQIRRQDKLSLLNGVKLLLFTARGLKMHLCLEGLLRTCDTAQTTLYSYWMSYDAYAAALSKGKHEGLRFLVRGHAYDIDEQRNPVNPYLLKRFIAERADGLFLISQYAMEKYQGYMQGSVAPEKLHIAGVGSRGSALGEMREPPFFQDGELRLVSCAAISGIKQLPMLVDALAAWQGPKLHWLHMGGGPEEARLRAYAQSKLGGKPNVTFTITGRMDNEKVQETYSTQAFDVFVNTSRMEGTPVSIMEAMRFGIPVIAPRVGGIPELADDSTGILYEPEKGAEGVREALEAFARLSRGQVMDMRRAAGKRWEAKCRMDRILPLVFGAEKDGAGGVKADG